MDSCSNSPSHPLSPVDSDSSTAWQASLETHQDSLRTFIASKLNGQGESFIDDVLQEVALAANAVQINSLDPSRIGAWLRQVAAHKVQDHWRKVGRQQRLHVKLERNNNGATSSGVSPYEWVVNLEQRDLVITALKSLPKEDRDILEQKYLHDRTYGQIATDLGISLKTLEYRLTRARQALRKILESAKNKTSNLNNQ